MKRFYSKKKRSKAKEDALGQIRKTREKLKKQHPELLQQIQTLYMEQQKQAAKRDRERLEEPESHEIAIDQNKSIETVIKFLELSNSEEMNKKIKTVLSASLH